MVDRISVEKALLKEIALQFPPLKEELFPLTRNCVLTYGNDPFEFDWEIITYYREPGHATYPFDTHQKEMIWYGTLIDAVKIINHACWLQWKITDTKYEPAGRIIVANARAVEKEKELWDAKKRAKTIHNCSKG